MGQDQGYANHDDFQVLKFTAVFTVKSSSVGWNR